jgi:Flp pilus assembly protein CpaB
VENIMSSKLFRTRQGTILLGVVAAVLAAIALIVYLNHYRSSVNSTATLPVLVAKSAIPQNTSGQLIASSGLYTTQKIAKSDVQDGALTDPSQLANQVAATDIVKGQQLTQSDFTGVSGAPLASTIPPKQRAVVIPLDSPGQVGGQIAAGDSVDVYALISTASGAPVVKEILQNMYVMNTNSDGNVTLRATPREAGQLIFASGNDKIWLTLRPPRGSMKKSPAITSNNLGG